MQRLGKKMQFGAESCAFGHVAGGPVGPISEVGYYNELLGDHLYPVMWNLDVNHPNKAIDS
jgi:hypothetical protein